MAQTDDLIALLPHRYPFLLVDRVTEIEAYKRIVGLKNVTINEFFFQGHFPGRPIMPGVMIIEAMAQVGGILALYSDEALRGKTSYFIGIDNARFRAPVFPGDQLKMEVVALKKRGSYWKFKGSAYVGEKLVTEAEISTMVKE